MKAHLLRGTVLAALLLASTGAMSAGAANSRDARIEHVTDQFVAMLRIGELLDEFAAKDARWPLGEKASGVSADKLKCLRDELSSAGYRRQKDAEVREYYRDASDEQLANDTRVLDAGAAQVMGKLLGAAYDAKRAGKTVDQRAALQGVSGEQMSAMVEFIQAPEFKGLRKLSGLGSTFGGMSGSGADAEDAGKGAGASMVSKIMFKAMDTCAIPPATLL